VENHLWTKAEVDGSIEHSQDIEDITKKNSWHELFESPKWIQLNPADEVLHFYRKYLQNPDHQAKRQMSGDYKKMHDLGVGGGRHLFFFSELGYDVVGSDLSTNATEFVDEEIQKRQIVGETVVCPMTDLPFEDGSFDITISRATMNHATMQDMKKSVAEVARTTRKDGLFFLTVSSKRASDFRRGIEVVPDQTYILPDGPEAGLIHTFFASADAAALLEPFFVVQEVFLAEHPPHTPDAPGATDVNEYFGSEYVIIGIRR
jgi:SAM-dependent methyltransferase